MTQQRAQWYYLDIITSQIQHRLYIKLQVAHNTNSKITCSAHKQCLGYKKVAHILLFYNYTVFKYKYHRYLNNSKYSTVS